MDTKSPLLSRTLWVNAIVAIAALVYPPAAAWTQAHPEAVLFAFSVINMILRLATKTGVQIG